jgi:hypothetical protein
VQPLICPLYVAPPPHTYTATARTPTPPSRHAPAALHCRRSQSTAAVWWRLRRTAPAVLPRRRLLSMLLRRGPAAQQAQHTCQQ